ncbi:hypothetical protein IFT80_02570 [Pseudomonas sp. CFBP 8771]|uniref:hypothetical protein n=1 Tax=Pseudomonas sp. CFBP 8771 TaxID=2775285 RepID=UPI0017827957|nr:hypothetical protein [Pseudomonas sp. CFBP 8771]MBD8601521.1 hypothetical protein [Pseudomonas sp. CFBP 8771]
MPYIVINGANPYDPNNQVEYATEAEADAKAREILQSFPQSSIRTAQLLNSYSAKVTISTKAVPEPLPPAESPTAE